MTQDTKETGKQEGQNVKSTEKQQDSCRHAETGGRRQESGR